MKRILSLLCLGTLLLTLSAGCGKSDQPDVSGGSSPDSDVTVVTTGSADSESTTATGEESATTTTAREGDSNVSKTETTVKTTGKTDKTDKQETTTTTKAAEKTGHLSKSDTTVEPVRSLSQVLSSLSEAELSCDAYDMDKYLLPYWKGNIVYNESLNFIKDAKTGESAAPLLYKAEKILSVKNSALNVTYTEGKDYIYKDGKLVLPEGSAIHTFNYGDIYFNTEKPNESWKLKKNGYTLFKEGTYFHSNQVAVTYVHSEPWKGYKPAYQGSLIPNVIKKLTAGEDVSIVYLGDSITKGGNASGMFNVAPNMPIWTDMVTAALKKAYPKAKITSFSASENGATTVQALKNLRTLCCDKKPDLVIIGFGMNDGTDKSLTPERFRSNIESIMMTNDALNKKVCDYVLVSTTMPNPEIILGDDAAYHTRYSEVLYQLEKQGETGKTGGVVVGDMTAVHQYMLKAKRFFDMTANNVNHPNDFLVRGIAQLVTTMLIK